MHRGGQPGRRTSPALLANPAHPAGAGSPRASAQAEGSALTAGQPLPAVARRLLRHRPGPPRRPARVGPVRGRVMRSSATPVGQLRFLELCRASPSRTGRRRCSQRRWPQRALTRQPIACAIGPAGNSEWTQRHRRRRERAGPDVRCPWCPLSTRSKHLFGPKQPARGRQLWAARGLGPRALPRRPGTADPSGIGRNQ